MAIPNDYPYHEFKNLGSRWRLCVYCGRYFPEEDMIKANGRWYCANDHSYKFRKKAESDYRIDVTDDLD